MLFRIGQALSIAVIVGATAATAVMGAKASRHRGRAWYRLLRKPKLTPPDAVFGPVWTLERSASLSLWGIQQLLNGAWSPLFFRKQKTRAALADVVGLWLTLFALVRETRKLDRTASNLLLPYLGWVAFAAYLNYSIVKKNPKWLS